MAAPATQGQSALGAATAASELPPQARAARRFVLSRGWQPGQGIVPRSQGLSPTANARALIANDRQSSSPINSQGRSIISPQGSSVATWTTLGPGAVSTTSYGLVTGRITSIAIDPADSSGNHVYVGTTGGGVWMSENAATSSASSVTFAALTDSVSALGGATDASISIGAVSVQPGGGGVVLAGTGDPNDLSSSYYGAGLLRSTDGGNTWSLITKTRDREDSLGSTDYSFVGLGFAGFAWSTANTALVVAAVSDAYEGSLVNAVLNGKSNRGIYYSSDAGASWHLATLVDGTTTIEGPNVVQASTIGNAVTSVVWNPIRKLFMAAVRYHGYYQSSDGINWTRMSSQPGSQLTTINCPATVGSTGSASCPIFRGALAVNSTLGDTFAWTVSAASLDQGLWQDKCALSGSDCTSATVSFATQISTTALESTVTGGTTGIADGLYTLALAAVPQNQDTILLAGAVDLFRCSTAAGCVWRNTTNTSTCQSAAVAPYQHALSYNPSNTLEVLLGNDSGLWRSMDLIAQTGSVCSSTDASHYDNLNAAIGSLANVESISPVLSSPYEMMAGLGVNGLAGVKFTTASSTWPQILSGYGGAVAIDQANTSNWYANNAEAGVAINLCSSTSACNPSAFTQVIGSTQVGGDGAQLAAPAVFQVDPVDATQLLIATCRVWRGPASGSGWTSANLISGIFDKSSSTTSCQGDGQIRTLAAMKLTSTTELVYAGMFGSRNGGGNLGGHILKAVFDSTSSTVPIWTDLTSTGSVLNDSYGLNAFGFDVSSIAIDAHDATGKTVYVTVEAMTTSAAAVRSIYRTLDGGATWSTLQANLPATPLSAVVVDPQDAGTLYLGTDVGVYYTSNITNCLAIPYVCWTALGSGLPLAPVVALSASPSTASAQVLVAATYGRGLWQTALVSAGGSPTSATASPTSLSFASQTVGTTSAAQSVTITNTGTIALTPTSISIPSDFLESDNCVNQSIAAGATCTLAVSFRPGSIGAISGQLILKANIYGGQLTIDLTGTGLSAGSMSLAPVTINFGVVQIGSSSSAVTIMATNSGPTAVTISSASVASPFAISSDYCTGTTLASSSACPIKATFTPTAAGITSQTLTMVDTAGSQTVQLTGTGASAATDTLSPTSLSFAATAVNTVSAAQTVTLTNSGGVALTAVSVSIVGAFQQSTPCSSTLAAGASCAIQVSFAPTQTGTLSGTLTVTDALQTQTVALSGSAVATPGFTVSPTSMTFTNAVVGVASSPQTLTVTNAGSVSMASVGFQLTGSAASSYALQSNTCGTTLAAGASCTVQVVFTPSGTGAISAALSVSSATTGVTAVSVPLNGTAVVSTGFSLSPSSIGFGAVGLNQTSSAVTLTITNSSSSSIATPTLSVAKPFTVAAGSCTSALASGASCAATVSFTPTAAGSAAALLTVSSSSVTNAATASLSGMGFDFTATASGSSTQAVIAGQTASYTMILNTVSGVTGTYSYSYVCGSLPAKAVCTFNPTSLSSVAGVSGYVTLTISTGKATTGAVLPGGGGFGGEQARFASLLAVLLLPFVFFRRRQIFAALLLLVLTTGLISSCASAGLSGSGSGGSGTSGTTPTGTYTIPVTVTSTSVSHTVSYTLTVN